jgi:hypothetical protein
MYIQPTRTYYRGSEQRTARAPFLILCQPDTYPEPFDPITQTRALVRQVALARFGPWMMGTARAFGHSLTLSGAYGSDGLLKTVPPEVYARAVPVPPELMEQWAKGGGWNSAGIEAPTLRRWANANLASLAP